MRSSGDDLLRWWPAWRHRGSGIPNVIFVFIHSFVGSAVALQSNEMRAAVSTLTRQYCGEGRCHDGRSHLSDALLVWQRMKGIGNGSHCPQQVRLIIGLADDSDGHASHNGVWRDIFVDHRARPPLRFRCGEGGALPRDDARPEKKITGFHRTKLAPSRSAGKVSPPPSRSFSSPWTSPTSSYRSS